MSWITLTGSILWIAACAVGLANFSYASWEAAQHHEKTSRWVKKPQRAVIFQLAAVAACIGLGFSPGSWLVRWILLILAAAFAWQAAITLKNLPKNR